MNGKTELVSRKLSVENIDPDLFYRFKVCLLRQSLTMRDVIIDYLQAYVESAEAEAEKTRKT
ncbi:unnamed protein product [marine sediment metagenome]|uniref:Uncharacterized protein n=1 Tax=marine sediment metagenome TaxID=412755 RepID=X1S9B2_9ZZZZ